MSERYHRDELATLTAYRFGHSRLGCRGHYRDYYDQQLVDGVAALYRRDLELFGYGF